MRSYGKWDHGFEFVNKRFWIAFGVWQGVGIVCLLVGDMNARPHLFVLAMGLLLPWTAFTYAFGILTTFDWLPEWTLWPLIFLVNGAAWYSVEVFFRLASGIRRRIRR